MILTSSYGLHFKGSESAIKNTSAYYASAVKYLIPVVRVNWDAVEPISYSKGRVRLIECLIHSNKNNQAAYNFDNRFYKFPVYLRRAAIADAIGKVTTYFKLFELWIKNECEGVMPQIDTCDHLMPCFFNGNMFNWDQLGRTAQIKVYVNNDWVWREIRLSKTDIRYLNSRKQLHNAKLSAPVIEKKHGHYQLRFTIQENVKLHDTPIFEQKICAVDLGVGTDAVCSVLDSQGTVLSREFINFGREKDSVSNALHRVSDFQRYHGSHDSGRLWNLAKRRNLNHARLIANAIVDYAVANDCHTIVFEHLDTAGKKKGSKKQKLVMWKHRDVQNTAERLAHRYGMRISRVCAWNTSKLAYDGSGNVKRGSDVPRSEKTESMIRHSICKGRMEERVPYDICQFMNGKLYNCDLNASYNIGARYFIRELLKALPQIQAEVPDLGSGSSRTLADLWQLNTAIGTAVN